MREAGTLASLALSGRLSLFVGAGVSAGAGLPAWQELLDALCDRPEVCPCMRARAHTHAHTTHMDHGPWAMDLDM